MKRLLLPTLLCMLLVCSCVSSGPAAEELAFLPEDAQVLMIYNATAGNGVNGQGVMLDAFEAEGTGYLVLEVEYESGMLQDLSIRMNSPDNRTVMEVADGMRDGIYRSSSGVFSEGENYVIHFGQAEALKVRLTVRFVAE